MPKPGKQRQKEYVGRLKAEGYRRVCFWVHEDDVQLVKDTIAELAEGRELDEQV